MQVQTRLEALLKNEESIRTKAHFRKSFYESVEYPHDPDIPSASISRYMKLEA